MYATHFASSLSVSLSLSVCVSVYDFKLVDLQMDAPSCCRHNQCAGCPVDDEPEKFSSLSANRANWPGAGCRWASHVDARWSRRCMPG